MPISLGRRTDHGLFIAFEGGEGSGKSTQATRLRDWLSSMGHEVVLTREPGGTDVGAALRAIVLDPATGHLSPRAEALIYAADKAEHVDSMIDPELERGSVVITDRYVDSTLAYQGAGRDIDVAELESIARWATADLRPHLTIVLDIDPEVGLARAGTPDRIEAEPIEFHRRVRQYFLDMAEAEPEHYAVLAADTNPDQLAEQIQSVVSPFLGCLA